MVGVGQVPTAILARRRSLSDLARSCCRAQGKKEINDSLSIGSRALMTGDKHQFPQPWHSSVHMGSTEALPLLRRRPTGILTPSE